MGKITRRKQLALTVGTYYDSDCDEMIHNPEFLEVTDSDEQDEFIGLYDHEGEPLYRLAERVKIGFHPPDAIDEE